MAQASARACCRALPACARCGGAAPDPKIHNLFQIADVDSSVIRWLNADLVTHIFSGC